MTVALTNKVPTAPVRGAGRPQAVFIMERLMDRIARELKLDRVEVRRRNMIKPEQMPYEIPLIFRDGKPIVYHGGDFPKSQDTAVEQSRYETFRARQAEALAQGRYIGIGIANYVEGTGLGPFEGVTVRVLTNGKVAVATGATNQGQGTRTTLSQIIADQVGCRIEDIVMTVADTGAISQGVGGFASRQAINAGSSAQIAGIAVRKQIVALAARALGVPESEIDIEDSEAVARGGNKPRLTFSELARMAQGVPGSAFPEGQVAGLEHTAYFAPPQASYCNGTHIVEVEVDPMTGGVAIGNYTVGHDSGTIINPMIVDGQVQGGVAHGIGNALFEHMKYDADANPLTTTFQDYLMPGAHRRAGLQDHPRGNAESAQSARREGCGRRRHHPGAGRDRRGDRGCTVAVQRTVRRDAADAGAHRRGAARSRRLRQTIRSMSATPISKSPFWQFSVKFYAEPGVAQACIDLQDQASVDVNILFFLLWNATQNRALGNSEVAELERDIGPWRDMAVVPLRNVRRALKAPPAVMAPQDAEGFRTRIKAVELEAERLQQEAMYGLAQSGRIGRQAPSKMEAARASVEAYQAVLRPFPGGPLDIVLSAFAKFQTPV